MAGYPRQNSSGRSYTEGSIVTKIEDAVKAPIYLAVGIWATLQRKIPWL